MSALGNVNQQMTRYRWVICAMLFFATTVNYLDRQVLSLLQPMLEEEFHWTDNDYGTITAIFSLFYAISMLFAGRFIDWMGTRKGYLMVNCCLVCRGGTSCIVWCINRKMGRITRCRCVTGCSCRNRPCGYDQYGKCHVLYYSTLCAGSW